MNSICLNFRLDFMKELPFEVELLTMELIRIKAQTNQLKIK